MSDEWPHNPDGEEGSEGRRKYGHAVLVKKVDEEEDFPLRAGEYVDQYGDHPVRLDDETVVAVTDVFEGIDDDEEFEDILAFHRRIGRVMRDSGLWTYEGATAFDRA